MGDICFYKCTLLRSMKGWACLHDGDPRGVFRGMHINDRRRLRPLARDVHPSRQRRRPCFHRLQLTAPPLALRRGRRPRRRPRLPDERAPERAPERRSSAASSTPRAPTTTAPATRAVQAGGSSWSSPGCSLLEIIEFKARRRRAEVVSAHSGSVLVSFSPSTACLLLVSFVRTRVALRFVDNSRRSSTPLPPARSSQRR
jgi:hypothetical protein